MNDVVLLYENWLIPLMHYDHYGGFEVCYPNELPFDLEKYYDKDENLLSIHMMYDEIGGSVIHSHCLDYFLKMKLKIPEQECNPGNQYPNLSDWPFEFFKCPGQGGAVAHKSKQLPSNYKFNFDSMEADFYKTHSARFEAMDQKVVTAIQTVLKIQKRLALTRDVPYDVLKNIAIKTISNERKLILNEYMKWSKLDQKYDSYVRKKRPTTS